MNTQYPSGAGSLFATMARQTIVTIWAYCQYIGDCTEQTFLRDEGIYEVYACDCGHEHRYAVR